MKQGKEAPEAGAVEIRLIWENDVDLSKDAIQRLAEVLGLVGDMIDLVVREGGPSLRVSICL